MTTTSTQLLNPAEAAARWLLTRSGRLDPYPHYAVLREHPAADVRDGVTMLSRYADVDRVLRDPVFRVCDPAWYNEFLPDRAHREATRLTGHSMLTTNPPRHTQMRRLVSWAFTPRRVAAMHSSVHARVTQLLDRLAEAGAGGRTVDFATEFAYQLPVNVVGDILGIPVADRPLFGPWAHDLDATLELTQTSRELIAADTAARNLREYFLDLARSRRRNPTDDLVSGLIEASTWAAEPPESPLSIDELVANIAVVLVNGFATTNDLLTNGLVLLMQRPELVQRLKASPDLVEPFVQEVLRYDAPVQLTMRVAAEAVEIAGRRLRQGDAVVALIGSANRDPRQFVEPDRFDIDRVDNQPLSFGAGPHYCFGAPLARLEARIAFENLLVRFASVTPAGVPQRRRNRLTLRGFSSVPVVVTPA